MISSSPTYKCGYYGKAMPINADVEIIMSENVMKNPLYSLGSNIPMLIVKNDIFLKGVLVKKNLLSSGGHFSTYEYSVLFDGKIITSTNDEPVFYFKETIERK